MTKTIACFLFLFIILFNWAGYQALTAFLEEKANSRLENRLDDNHYDLAQLVTIKIPVRNLAYYSNSSQFERISGEIELNGLTYHYVRKRLFRDSLEFQCIDNEEVTRLHTARDDFFKLVCDLQAAGQSKKAPQGANISKILLMDYYLDHGMIQTPEASRLSTCWFDHSSASLSVIFLSLREPPPKFS